jgi:hypothetical protein
LCLTVKCLFKEINKFKAKKFRLCILELKIKGSQCLIGNIYLVSVEKNVRFKIFDALETIISNSMHEEHFSSGSVCEITCYLRICSFM